MDFKLTEEQLAVRDAARDFAKNVLLPEVRERDKSAKEKMKLIADDNKKVKIATFFRWKHRISETK